VSVVEKVNATVNSNSTDEDNIIILDVDSVLNYT
jgi:hypothetical protein